MYEVWRNLKFDVRRLSENCLKYVQSLNEVLRMSVQNLESKN